MASDTNTKTHKPRTKRSNFDALMDLYWGGTERRISALTLRIIGINAISVIMLILVIINLGRYETQIIETKLAAFQQENILIAEILGQNQNQDLIQSLANRTGHDIIVTNQKGVRVAYASPATIHTPTQKQKNSVKTLQDMVGFVLQLVPDRIQLPPVPVDISESPDIKSALKGMPSINAWQSEEHSILLTSAAPLSDRIDITGTVYLTRSGADIAQDVAAYWEQMMQIFLITLVITVFISIYLSGLITRPLRRLTSAAEAIRRSKGKQDDIPDLSDRLDEIGELSLVMRDMTDSLKNRLNSIERFAADVAHELKNPLTSLKSAVETLRNAKDKKNQRTLLDIIEQDIQRMDRLITDISGASRLDAELAREDMERVNLTELLYALHERYQNQYSQHIALKCVRSQQLYIWGIQDRLVQVFDNLLANAVSFSSEEDQITIKAEKTSNQIHITIEDEGPGLPEDKLDDIFDRFYSERPAKEDFGNHSGLGLAICKRIINAFDGHISAENRSDPTKKTIGARFIIALKSA